MSEFGTGPIIHAKSLKTTAIFQLIPFRKVLRVQYYTGKLSGGVAVGPIFSSQKPLDQLVRDVLQGGSPV